MYTFVFIKHVQKKRHPSAWSIDYVYSFAKQLFAKSFDFVNSHVSEKSLFK